MASVVALQAGVLVFNEWVKSGLENVVVHDIANRRSVRLEGYENCKPIAISHDGERIALFRGKRWEGRKNEIVVIEWRARRRLFYENDQAYGSALFDITGALLLVTIEKQKSVCFDVLAGEVVAQTSGKHETLQAHHFDVTRNVVWLPPTSRRAKKRQLFDFGAREEREAPAVVDAVSPGGALYRADSHLTRLDASFQPMWSVAASTPGMEFDLPPVPRFPGTEDVVVLDEPDPGKTWGFWVSRNAATGKELARRRRASGESPEVAWPGRSLVQPNEGLVWSVDKLSTKSVDLLAGLGKPSLDPPIPASLGPAKESAPTSLELTTTDVTTAMIVAGRTFGCRLSAADVEAMCELFDELAERLALPLVFVLSADFSSTVEEGELVYFGAVGLLCSSNDAHSEPKPVSAEKLRGALGRAARLPWKDIEASLPALEEPLSATNELLALATGPLAGFELAFGVPIAEDECDRAESPKEREPSLSYVAGRDMSQARSKSGVWGISACAFGDWPMESLDAHLAKLEEHRTRVGSLAAQSSYFILPHYD